MKTCPDCAEEVKVDARKCKHCGYEFQSAGRRWLNRIGAIVICGIIAAVAVGYMVDQNNKTAKSQVDSFTECVQRGRANCSIS